MTAVGAVDARDEKAGDETRDEDCNIDGVGADE
jgi:hypothetical protein